MSAQVLGINRGSPEADVSREGTNRRTEDRRTLVYEVQVDVKTQGVDTVLQANGLPRIGDSYDYFGERQTDLRCRRLSPKQREDLPILWDVTAYYERDVEEEAEVEIDFEIIRTPITGSHSAVGTTYSVVPAIPTPGQIEVHQAFITNSRGDLLDPPAEGDEGMMVLRISRNEFVRDLQTFARLNNSVNRDRIFDGEPRQWRMFVKARPIQNHFQNKWRVSYELHFRKATWDLRLADRGPKYNDGAGGIQPFKDDQQNPMIGNLDGNGGQAAANQTVFLRFQWLRPEQWPADLEATVRRYYSEQGAGGQNAGARREANNRDPGLARLNRRLQGMGLPVA